MKRQKIKVVLLVLVLSLFAAATVSAANIDQILLNALTIPKFVEPLPVAGQISVVDASSNGLNGTPFTVNAEEFKSQILPQALNWPGAPATCGEDTSSWTWGYLVDGDSVTGVRPSYLGPVIIAERGVPAYPKYGNKLPEFGQVQANLPIDMTLDWANPTGIDCTSINGLLPMNCSNPNTPYSDLIPIATHLHGGEVAPAYDGGPDAWFTQDTDDLDLAPDYTGAGYPGPTYEYPNDQQESTIWFHDHALGITRLNVYAGLAGLYPIIDPTPNTPAADMPAFPQYDIPLIIQDRSFDTNCQIFYNLASNPQPNPEVHPFWIPEFIGDTIVVNGKTWPYLDVEERQYRFRLVNGSNARFYDLSLGGGLKFYVIATDDGYLEKAVRTGNLIIGPGERYEVIVDFKNAKGQKNKPFKSIIMTNIANTPFPGGGPPIAGLTDTVMEFRVYSGKSAITDTNITDGTILRTNSNPILAIQNAHDTFTGANTGSITRQLTLNEVIGKGGPLELVVNNSKFNLNLPTPGCPDEAVECRETELPAIGDTEIWEIINITADAHPMHTHLTSFQVLDRTPFKAAPWIAQYDGLLRANGVPDGEGPPNQYNVKNADGAIGGNPAVGPFLDLKNRRPPLPYEMGWKDTVITYPGEVTRIAVRWATTDTAVAASPGGVGTNTYPFNPADTELSRGVGYVWHCHIIDHEDNEMMRNYVVGEQRQPVCNTPTDCP